MPGSIVEKNIATGDSKMDPNELREIVTEREIAKRTKQAKAKYDRWELADNFDMQALAANDEHYESTLELDEVG